MTAWISVGRRSGFPFGSKDFMVRYKTRKAMTYSSVESDHTIRRFTGRYHLGPGFVLSHVC